VKRLWLAILLAAAPAWPQLAAGKLLVATPKSQDRDFARTVILLIRFDPQSAVGLILNRPTDIPVAEALPDLKGARSAQLRVFAGGPILTGVRALFRSREDVSVLANQALRAKLIAGDTPASTFRVYAGYTGWTAGQLKSEVERGLWRVLASDPAVVFDPHPETLWPRLSK
jgi:putative transcriptional regulator